MAITHSTAQRDIFADSVDTAIGASGNMVLKTGVTEVATIPLNSPAFGASSSGVITLDNTGPPEDSSATGNGSAVDTFEFQTSGAVVVFSGAVPADLTLSKNPIDPGDTVQLTSFTYTASP